MAGTSVPVAGGRGRSLAQREQVVVHRKALRLRGGLPVVSLRSGRVQVAPRGRSDVAGDPARAPAQVVGRRDVGEHVEALLAQVDAGLLEPGRVDDERRLAERLPRLDEAGDALEGQDATPRIS